MLKEGIAVLSVLLTGAVAIVLATESEIYRQRSRIWSKQQRLVLDIFCCCLKLKFSSNVTPIFNTRAAGVTL